MSQLKLTAKGLLTKSQRQVMSFIMAHQSAKGRFPSTREMQRHFKWKSQNTAVTYLKYLVEAGRIEHHKGVRQGSYSIVFQVPTQNP